MSSKTILIVDDDPRNVFALNAVLKARGYPTACASSAQECIDILSDRKDIAIVLMDMMMPDMDGYEAIGEIRQQNEYAGLPIIAVTAQAMVGDRERCMAAGASDYISKPVDIEVLVRLLTKHLM